MRICCCKDVLRIVLDTVLSRSPFLHFCFPIDTFYGFTSRSSNLVAIYCIYVCDRMRCEGCLVMDKVHGLVREYQTDGGKTEFSGAR